MYAARWLRNVGPFVAAILLLGSAAWGQTPSPVTLSDDELAAVKAAENARINAIAKVYGSVVAIYGNDRQGGGSGVLYDPAGYALTNHHVVAAAGDEGWAGLADGKLCRWKMLGTDPGGDVAIIRLLGRDDFPVAILGDSETVRVGNWAMAMGNPFVLAEDQRPTVTLGIVSGVHRYQPGDGLNTLVYGNCIQVDSSINPGNSGGPLFNLRGEVIGINGRGSFEERGRVNVGLGYAISSNQVKNFIPDLLATKVAQHGTLDAQFGNRAGGVICQTLNLNAPVARLGLELGDRLISFEGVEINNANQFTNLITTYPADWPCEVTFEHQGERKTVHVRLTPLPYDLAQPKTATPPKPGEPAPMPEGDKKDTDGGNAENKSEGEDKPAEPPKEQKENQPVRVELQRAPLEPGKVRFSEVNRESTAHLLKQWNHETGTLTQAIKATEELVDGDKVIGNVTLLVGSDQRFVVRHQMMEETVAVGFDGQAFWRQENDETPQAVSFEKAVRDPLVAYALAMAVARQGKWSESLGQIALQGGDKAQNQIAYRLAAGPEEEDPMYFWLSVFDEQGRLGVSLLKTGVGIHHDEPVPALTYHDWQKVEDYHWPYRKLFVRGLAERPGHEIRTKQVTAAEVTDATFRMPEP